jgi:hypothetical protein
VSRAVDLIEKISRLPRPSINLEPCSVIIVGDIENIDPVVCFKHRFEGSDSSSLEPHRSSLPRIEGGIWIEYLKSYREAIDRRMRILLIDKTKYKVLILDGSSPLAPAVLSSRHIDGNSSIAFLIIPGRGIPLVLIDRTRSQGVYGFTGGRILRHRALEARISEEVVRNIEQIMGFIRASKKVGVREYIVGGIIGASLKVYGSIYNTFRALEKSILWSFRDPGYMYRSRALYVIAKMPKAYLEELSSSYFKYLGGFIEMMSHNMLYIEYETRLELYDIIALLGYPEIGIPEHVIQGHRALITMNPAIEMETEEVLP